MTRRPGLATLGWFAALVPAVGIGCNGSGGPLPFNQFEPTALVAVCHLEVLCRAYPDQATCMASVQTEPHLYDTLGPDIASGKVVYDGASARACLDAINALSSCNRSAAAGIDASGVCSRIFTGTVAAGGACFFSEECVGQGACLATTSCASGQCCAGTCQAGTVTAPLGGNCLNGVATCAAGTVCLPGPTAGTDTCQNPVGVGAACTSSTACAPGLYCEPNSMTCRALVATGGACNPSLNSQDCDSEADRCDSTSATCLPPLALGSPCANSTQTCVSYATCDATSGTCVARPGVGAACDATSGPSCLGGNCDATTGTCMLTPTAGACS